MGTYPSKGKLGGHHSDLRAAGRRKGRARKDADASDFSALPPVGCNQTLAFGRYSVRRGAPLPIEHSAGSGKSNSIAWLVHQLVGIERNGMSVFDSIIVVTDRRQLDKQIRNTIRHFAQVSATLGFADESSQLRQLIQSGKKIIITTIQKFPFILDEIGSSHRAKTFAIIIDEAHSARAAELPQK